MDIKKYYKIKYENNKEIIMKYWDKKYDKVFSKEIKDFTKKYGAEWQRHFSNPNVIKRIIGADKYNQIKNEFNNYLANKEKIVNGIGNAMLFFLDNRYGYCGTNQVKFDVPKNSKGKKCLYCGKSFLPSHINTQLKESYNIKKNYNEISYCEKCLIKAFFGGNKEQKTKEELIKDLQDFVNALGFIPPKNYFLNSNFTKNINENFNKIIPVLITIAPVSVYEEEFGSWLKALISADILKGNVRETSRGIMCVAEDDHDCLSLSERRIDDWLYKNKIKHTKEPRYPKDKEFNPNGFMRADWKVEDIFIEFFGLSGNLDYDNKSEIKRKLCKKYSIYLIEIFNEDLDKLYKKLCVLTKLKND